MKNLLSLKTGTSLFRKATVANDFVNDDSQFGLYPNPVFDKLIITSNKEEISSAIFSVFDLMGQQILESKEALIKEGKAVLDVTVLNAGEYFLGIRYDEGIEVKKFIVIK